MKINWTKGRTRQPKLAWHLPHKRLATSFERKYDTFKNGRLPASEDEVKDLMAHFNIQFCRNTSRLLNWRKLKEISSCELNLGLEERCEVQEDIEDRIDGPDLVSKVLELLASNLAIEKDVELETLRVIVLAYDVSELYGRALSKKLPRKQLFKASVSAGKIA